MWAIRHNSNKPGDWFQNYLYFDVYQDIGAGLKWYNVFNIDPSGRFIVNVPGASASASFVMRGSGDQYGVYSTLSLQRTDWLGWYFQFKNDGHCYTCKLDSGGIMQDGTFFAYRLGAWDAAGGTGWRTGISITIPVPGNKWATFVGGVLIDVTT